MEVEKVLLALGGVVLLVVVLSKLKTFAGKRKLNLPPGPWTLPVIGSVHHLITCHGGMYRAMAGLSAKHGPLMQLWLGEVPTVVASSPEAARAILKTNDLTFATRQLTATTRTATFEASDLIFAPYGERWRELRRICVLELLSVSRVQSLRRVREEEVARLVGSLAASAAAGEAVDVTRSLANLVNDTVVRESIGSRCKHQDEYLRAFDTLVRQTSSLTAADLFPSSKLMQLLGTAPRKARACRDKMEAIIEQIIGERLESMAKCDDVDDSAGHGGDFLGVLLRLQKEDGTITNRDILKLLFDMFGAGSDTSSTTLNWAMAELMRTPRVMAKAQAELREAFRGKTTVTEDDVAGVTYLKLVIKEALRLHCPLLLLLPRECRETCTVMGYDVPKGTAVLVNAWAICRDPEVWGGSPEEFRPERFLEDGGGIDYKGASFEFLPFGSGRRMCPGVNLGVANMELALASILYHFDWELPDGARAEDMDMREAAGMVASKRAKLHLRPITRVAPSCA